MLPLASIIPLEIHQILPSAVPTALITYGVFECFPKLTLGVSEHGFYNPAARNWARWDRLQAF